MSKADEFLERHGPNLTPEQAAQLMELVAEGETGTPEIDESPTVEQQEEAKEPEASEAGDEKQPVLLAKDGVHTIPYETLTAERTARQQEQQRANGLQQQLEEAKAALAAAQSTGKPQEEGAQEVTESDIKALRKQIRQAVYEGDDDKAEELEDKLDEALARQQEAIAEARVAAVRAELDQIKGKHQQDEAGAHMSAIMAKHPDVESIAQSQELKDWAKAQVDSAPGYMRESVKAGIARVLAEGSAQEVIELLDAFKSSKPQPAAVKEAAAKAVAEAKKPAPVSLSEIPGGTVSTADKFERLASPPPDQLADALSALPRDQVNQFLNRLG